MSVISFILLVSGLKRSRKMIKYNEHAGLNHRMPGYQVRLGLGLHLGYAIEGAIGSYYKIDASYLSSHVRMSERLEGSTKHYGVPLLISETLHKNLTRYTKGYCRVVDYCVMKGVSTPVRLYTIDIDSTNVPLEEEQSYMNAKQKKI
jgi:class 3 adenylate cyclase